VPEAGAEFAAETGPVRKCLVVDDSRVIRKITRQIVERVGYEVFEAENGQEALQRCHADMPDLVMLDWDMPVMSGIDFIAALRRLEGGFRPKVVFCTSKGASLDVHKAFEAGADEYVVKPFDRETLEAKLQRIGAA
jgi:two-component system chemotaxis response regulator CheY